MGDSAVVMLDDSSSSPPRGAFLRKKGPSTAATVSPTPTPRALTPTPLAKAKPTPRLSSRSGAGTGEFDVLLDAPTAAVTDSDIVELNPTGGSNLAAWMNMIKSMMGAGLLAIPKALTSSGLLLGIISFCILATICIYTMLSLVSTARKLRQRSRSKKIVTYGDVAFGVFGKKGELFVHVFVITMEIIFATGIVIVVPQTLEAVFPSLKGSSTLIQAVLFVPCSLLCLISLMKDLWVISLLGVAVYLVGVVGSTFYLGVDLIVTEHVDYEWEYATWSSLGVFMGTSIYALEGINQILPVEASMKHQGQAMWVLGSSNIVYCLVLVVYGSFGYVVGFGECDVVIACLPPGILQKIVSVALCLSLVASYPLVVYPVFEMVEPLIAPVTVSWFAWKRRAFRVAIVATTIGIAVLTGKNFSLLSAFTGALLSSVAGFIFPPLLAIFVDYPNTSKWTYALNVPVILIGVASAIFGLYSSVLDVVDKFA
eukprot:TRINITY_DN2352_c0_g5_i1.p1 TRINITY_DN2352_c0_g5~~TRINITY_DN2352_c0_g5_i1.p1  ORF type:complete len:549 (-),score=119.63 TRINITY_DN2352_c0_g5_i1:47-1495(-)